QPKNLDDLILAARNCWLQCFDNISSMPTWLSDSLCRVSTGEGFSKRELYRSLDETIISVMRPVMIGSIGPAVRETDLNDRTMKFTLPVIPDQNYKELDAAFDAARPRLLGGLCDAIATALARSPTVEITKKSRMLGACKWVTAASPALGWTPDRYVDAVAHMRAVEHTEELANLRIIPCIRTPLGPHFAGDR